MAAAAATMLATLALPAQAEAGQHFNRSGDVLIADQFNNRVIEVDPTTHRVVWHFGSPSSCGPNSIAGTNDAQRVGPLTLMAGTGVPPGSPDPACPNGSVDNRVLLVNPEGHIVWQYGQFGVTGSGPDQLNVPVQDTWLPNGDVLITDQGNERVIEVDSAKQIVWQYGTTAVTGSGFNELNNPNSAELLANGHILIADENNNRVIEVTRQHQIVWQYGSPSSNRLSGAAFASRLPNGDTLITDSNHSRIVEVTMGKVVVWQYFTNRRPGSVAQPLPTRAVRLADGNTLISDQFNNQVIEVNRAKQIVFRQGQVGASGAGSGFDRLNAPYDAKVIGDYTGLTPPFGF